MAINSQLDQVLDRLQQQQWAKLQGGASGTQPGEFGPINHGGAEQINNNFGGSSPAPSTPKPSTNTGPTITTINPPPNTLPNTTTTTAPKPVTTTRVIDKLNALNATANFNTGFKGEPLNLSITPADWARYAPNYFNNNGNSSGGKNGAFYEMIRNGASAEVLADYLRRNPDVLASLRDPESQKYIKAINNALNGKLGIVVTLPGSSKNARQAIISSEFEKLRTSDPAAFKAWKNGGQNALFDLYASRDKVTQQTVAAANSAINNFAYDHGIPLYGLTAKGPGPSQKEFSYTVNKLASAGMDLNILVSGGYITKATAMTLMKNRGAQVTASQSVKNAEQLATMLGLTSGGGTYWQGKAVTKAQYAKLLKQFQDSLVNLSSTGLDVIPGVKNAIQLQGLVTPGAAQKMVQPTIANLAKYADANGIKDIAIVYGQNVADTVQKYGDAIKLLKPYEAPGGGGYYLQQAVDDTFWKADNGKPTHTLTNTQMINLQDALVTVFGEKTVQQAIDAPRPMSKWDNLKQAYLQATGSVPEPIKVAAVTAASTPFPEDDAAVNTLIGILGAVGAAGVAITAFKNNRSVSSQMNHSTVVMPNGTKYPLPQALKISPEKLDGAALVTPGVDGKPVKVLLNEVQVTKLHKMASETGAKLQQEVTLPGTSIDTAGIIANKTKLAPLNKGTKIPLEAIPPTAVGAKPITIPGTHTEQAKPEEAVFPHPRIQPKASDYIHMANSEAAVSGANLVDFEQALNDYQNKTIGNEVFPVLHARQQQILNQQEERRFLQAKIAAATSAYQKTVNPYAAKQTASGWKLKGYQQPKRVFASQKTVLEREKELDLDSLNEYHRWLAKRNILLEAWQTYVQSVNPAPAASNNSVSEGLAIASLELTQKLTEITKPRTVSSPDQVNEAAAQAAAQTIIQAYQLAIADGQTATQAVTGIEEAVQEGTLTNVASLVMANNLTSTRTAAATNTQTAEQTRTAAQEATLSQTSTATQEQTQTKEQTNENTNTTENVQTNENTLEQELENTDEKWKRKQQEPPPPGSTDAEKRKYIKSLNGNFTTLNMGELQGKRVWWVKPDTGGKPIAVLGKKPAGANIKATGPGSAKITTQHVGRGKPQPFDLKLGAVTDHVRPAANTRGASSNFTPSSIGRSRREGKMYVTPVGDTTAYSRKPLGRRKR